MMGVVGTKILVAGQASAAGWIVTPSITLQELGTDNVYETQNNKKADAITQLIPGLSVTDNGPRSQILFSYAPILSGDLAQPGQDRVDQNLLSNGHIGLLEQWLSVDFNAFATQGSGSGGNITTGASDLVPLSDRVLNYGGSITPHLSRRFGDAATLDVTYQISSSNETGNNQTATNGGFSSDLLQQDARIVVGSGNSFGRLTGQLYLDHAFGSGSGSYNQFDNDTDLLKFEYHLTHKYSLIGYVGYQRIHYDTNPIPITSDIHGLVWSIGGRITPNDFTDINVSYSRQSGAYAPEISVKYDLSPRTHIYGGYTVSIENQLQQNLAYLNNLGTGVTGVPTDIRTGLPFNNTNNQLFGAANVLYRDKLATVSATRQFTRSSLSIVAGNEQRQPLEANQTTDTAWYGGVTYTRELTPKVRGYADVGYSDRSFSQTVLNQRENDRIYNADVSLTWQINFKLSASATFSFFKRNSNITGFSATSDQVLIGIRKVF
jgi:uncharacterized protein (PEP-CTERM system associated)